MIPCTPIQQPQANAAVPRAGSRQLAHASPEALFWHFVCDEICEVLCEVICDDTERGAGTLTASAASTLKRWREEDAATPVADADPPPRELPHVASAASPWVAACADLLEAAKDRKNMTGLRTRLTSHGFRCGPIQESRRDGRFLVEVPPDFPCYYDLVGKDYVSNLNSMSTLTTLRKYLDGALALARTGGAYRTDAECGRQQRGRPRLRDEHHQRRVQRRIHADKTSQTSRFTGVSRDEKLGKWIARIYVQGSRIPLGDFDVEEDAARAYDAAVWKYELSGSGRRTLNFPGEAPRADVLDALPPPPPTRGVASRQIERERRPPRALPRGTTYPDGAMAPTAADPAVGVAGDDPQMKKKSASKKKKKKKQTAEPAKDGGEPKIKKMSGYNYHNAQNYELAKAMVESEPATAQLVACEKNQAVIKKLGAMWGELDDAARQAYVDDAAMVVKDGGEPKVKKQGGYQYHNAQNCKLARAMVESDPATAKLGAQEKIGAVNRKLGAMWSALDDAAKQAYADIAPMVAVKPRKAKKSKCRPEPAPASKKEPAHVCACCGGTTLTAAGEPMRTSVLFCEDPRFAGQTGTVAGEKHGWNIVNLDTEGAKFIRPKFLRKADSPPRVKASPREPSGGSARRRSAPPRDSEQDAVGRRVWALFEPDVWWCGTVVSVSGVANARCYSIVFDDGVRQSMWLRDVFENPPSGAKVGARGPNAQARAAVEKALSPKTPLKREREATTPRPKPSARKRARRRSPAAAAPVEKVVPVTPPATPVVAAPSGDCPICYERLAADATVFDCAHALCASCSETYAKVEAERSMSRRSGVSIACPLCRKKARVALPAGMY